VVLEIIKKALYGLNFILLLLGPSGVGKTETAKVLAKEVFGSDSSLVRVDMSEFMERHNVSRLTGAPAGYVGYEEGGKLTETVRRKPYSVVLFDEIEKAHPDVYNILLQILDEGELTDAAGKKINFKNTIIILTSNIGTTEFNKKDIGFDDVKMPEKDHKKFEIKIMAALKSQLKPELINRIDKILVYRALDKNSTKKIIRLELEKLAKRLTEKKLNVEYSDQIVEFLHDRSIDSSQSARKIIGNIQEFLESILSEQILLGNVPDNSKILFQVNKKNKAKPIKIKVR